MRYLYIIYNNVSCIESVFISIKLRYNFSCQYPGFDCLLLATKDLLLPFKLIFPQFTVSPFESPYTYFLPLHVLAFDVLASIS